MKPAGASDDTGGWLLVGLIVILSSVFIALTGISMALGESRRVISMRENDTEAVYLAQAGVMQALYDLKRLTSAPPAGGIVLRAYNIDNPTGPVPGPNDDAFILSSGIPADFFLVNMKGSISFSTSNLNCGGGVHISSGVMGGWTVRNVLDPSSAPTLAVDRMQVNWSPDNGERVVRIVLNGANVWLNCAGAAAGQELDVTNSTINPRATWATNSVSFNSTTMGTAKDWIDLTFIMTDGSRRVARYDRLTPANRTADVTIRSRGEVREGTFPFLTWRRLQAEYRLSSAQINSTGNVLSYQELSTSN